MPPIRRYVRLTPHTLLEVRIFLENPSDTHRWLLSQTNPALPKVFDAVRPLILPKLREERERTAVTKGKGKKGKSVKDVVDGEGFRVVVFLTEGGTRHEVVVKRRTAKDSGRGGVEPGKRIALDSERGKSRADAVVIREEEEDDDIDLRDVPVAGGEDEEEEGEAGFAEIGARRRTDVNGNEEDDLQAYQEDKKKLRFDTRYEGFSIWGKVLCLLVERKGGAVKKSSSGDGSGGTQKVMQEWISSTQVGVEDDDG